VSTLKNLCVFSFYSYFVTPPPEPFFDAIHCEKYGFFNVLFPLLLLLKIVVFANYFGIVHEKIQNNQSNFLFMLFLKEEKL